MPNGKPRIVVIDDDLADRTLASVDAELRTLLGDVTDPVFETMWTRAQATGLVPAAGTLSAAERMRRAQQADFIQFVLGDLTLEQADAQTFNRYVRPTLNDIESRRQWFKAVERCFPPADFEIEKHSVQPDPAALVGSACVLLDLVGVTHGQPFEDATSFITKVADECSKNGEPLPRFMLVSSQLTTYQTRRNEFRAKANISASGLRLVEKLELTSSTGTDALRLVWTQMGDEQSVAGSLRTLCKALEDGQESLLKDLNTHVWNLDCDALLRIYRAAKEDSDPFEEHLLEFLARRLTWLVYENAAVRTALTSIATSLAERVPATDARIKRFYSAIGEDRRSLMELIGSYHWAPLHDQPDLAAVTEEQLKSDATRVLPFGAVLAKGEVVVGSEVFVHITQPCDLGHMKAQNSLKFVSGKLKKLNPDTELSPSPSQDFAPGLRIGEDYLTLEVDLNSAVSRPTNEMLGQLKDGPYRVIARLRHDIARRVLQKYAAHITRPDIPRFAYVAEVNARVFVKTRSITPAAEFPQEDFGNGTGAQGIMETTRKKNGSLDYHITLRGDYVTAVARWARETLLNSGGLGDLPPIEMIAMALRDGIKVSNPSTPNEFPPSLQIVAYEADASLTNKLANNPSDQKAKITIAYTKV